MSFTDDDLKRLKENMLLAFGNGSTMRNFDALLARLEAAELCAEHARLLASYLSKKSPDAFERGAVEVQQRRDEAWRKECGK